MTNTTQIDTVARRVVQLIEVGRDIYEAIADAIEAKGVVNVSEHDILVPGYNCSRLSIK